MNPPSKRIATPKTACTDPAIRTIVQNTQGLDIDLAIDGELTHNLFMSAENIQGNLLEEYISNNIRKYGFIWCKGNTLRAIDFCNSTGTVLLQIKVVRQILQSHQPYDSQKALGLRQQTNA